MDLGLSRCRVLPENAEGGWECVCHQDSPLLTVKAKGFVLDGEIIVPVKGCLSFEDLLQAHPSRCQSSEILSQKYPARVVVFDLLVNKKRGIAYFATPGKAACGIRSISFSQATRDITNVAQRRGVLPPPLPAERMLYVRADLAGRRIVGAGFAG